MTVPTTENTTQEKSNNDKELNFRALEQKYQRQLEQERNARLEAERVAKEAMERKSQPEQEEENDDQPYVDHKRLNKTLNKFGQTTQTEIQKAMEMAKQKAKEELKQEMWLEQNPDFYDVLQHAEKFAQKSPKLAETILKMPDNFDRQKLVYQNIKEFGLDRPEVKQPSIQETIDSRKRSPYYQPTNVGTAPYGNNSDFSPGGQKSAYEKMQALKAQLRI